MAKISRSITGDQIPSEIVKWSVDRPRWQRDALRRLVVNGKLSTDDLAELLHICKAARGFSDGGSAPPQALPLTSSHFPQVTPNAKPLVLREISEVVNVNALAPNQKLRFAAKGMTVVYGDNGSGKSGYARILKRACRARHRGDKIEPNVFQPPSTAAASASIHYEIDGKPQCLKWRDDGAIRPSLPAVSFFDTDCASVHVSKANDLAFTPYGLDLFEQLVSTCQALKVELEKELKAVADARPTSITSRKFACNTKVALLIAGLRPTTDPTTIDSLATITTQDQDRLHYLRAATAQDPSQLAAGVRSSRTRLQELLEQVARTEQALSQKSLNALRETKDKAEEASRAAELAASAMFTGEPLPGVGSNVWKRLWDSARAYSIASAYPNLPFPVLDDGVRCVLCQQPLTEEAVNRFRRFDEFVQQDTQTKATQAQNDYRDRQVAILGARIERAAFASHVGELKSLNENATSIMVRAFFLRSWLRYRAIQRATGSGDWKDIPEMPQSPAEALKAVNLKLLRQAEELEAAAKDQGRLNLLAELAELEDRVWLSSIRTDVSAEIDRQKKHEAMLSALKDVDTTAISTKSGALADAVVTASLRERFANEIDALNLKSAQVELVAAKSYKGARLYQIRLLAKPTADVPKILSEGENRCIALAAFLSELATSSHNSALVFDDPVSSLDHLHREAVAKRLAKESQCRQVIVFTHDLVFLHDLSRVCHPEPPSYQGISRTDTYAGWCEPDIPLRVKDTLLSIEHLAKQAEQIGQLYSNGKVQDYEEKARGLYGRLREAWETAVAEMIAPVISRFKRDVATKNLSKLSIITLDDCRTVDEQRAKCSLYQHNAAEASNQPPPSPNELKQDIQALKTWFSMVKERQGSIKASQVPETAQRATG